MPSLWKKLCHLCVCAVPQPAIPSSYAVKEAGETWDDVESCTLTGAELDAEFNGSYGLKKGKPFTAWTKDRMYFLAEYNGREWVESVLRNLNGECTCHIG